MMKIIKVRQSMPRGPVVVTNYELPLTPFVTRHENNEFIHVFLYQCAKAENSTVFYSNFSFIFCFMTLVPILSFLTSGAVIT